MRRRTKRSGTRSSARATRTSRSSIGCTCGCPPRRGASCALVPFKGLGGFVMGLRGKRPSNRNPRFCSARATTSSARIPGGAEVTLSLVFADVQRLDGARRAASAPPSSSRRMHAFYAAVTHDLVETDGFIIDVVGDEVVGVYPPGFSGEPRHAALAIEAARRARGSLDASPTRRSLPYGVGVHTGVVHIGTTMGADEGIADVRAIGDAVNVAARLSSSAKPGEALVSEAAWEAAGESHDDLEHRDLELKGRAETMRVAVVRAQAAVAAPV